MLKNELIEIYKKAKDENSVFKICDEKIKPQLVKAAESGRASAVFYYTEVERLVDGDLDEFYRWGKQNGFNVNIGFRTIELSGWAPQTVSTCRYLLF